MTDPSPLRILLVDDETAFCLAVAAFLRERSFEVDSCESGEEALEFLKRKTFDVILLDYRMPVMSGLNVLQWMHEQKLETPVIMLTGAGSETIAVEAMSLGAYDYQPKDRLDLDHLPITIHSAHERYLFRKDREARSMDDRFQRRTVETAAMMHSTLNSLAHVLNNNLSLMKLNVEEGIETILPQVPRAHASRVEKTFRELQQGLQLIASSATSMLALSESVYQRLSGSANAYQIERRLRDQIAALEEDHQRAMNEVGDPGDENDE